LDGSPAQKAGLKAGDIIVKVDDTFTQGWDLQKAVDKIRGQKGSTVVLGVIHRDEKKIASISIVRDTITVKSVFGWIKSVKDVDAISTSFKNKYAQEKVMYVRLSQFGDATNADWVTIVGNLAKQLKSDKSVKGVILDLRNNPGGYLTDATFIAGEFLKEGTPVVTEDPGNGDTTTLSVNRQGSLIDVPLVILINGGSASASEIVSGAMQDYGKATLVGDQSFGKGTIQQALDMGEGAGLHITIAKWLTPKGRWIHGKGLTPDVKVSLDPKDPSHDTQLEKAIEVLVTK
ncbi:MAG: S41 family peptidase, partial [Patescibacteria group bacterium]|nr:S41 family peptidase [Patescibacteria group bacterium]